MNTNRALVDCTIDGTQFFVELIAEGDAITACTMLGRQRKAAATEPAKGVLRDAAKQLRHYFSGKSNTLDIPLELHGTEFQQTVWDAARTIPAGEVRSYTWLARKVGKPRAVRAVASALGANPALLFVPCHRVLRSNGDLGGFSCGLEWKELLLAHEGRQ
ncbi:MAG: methylated-DNA--[protein]-cysteine S-methyltransferase [Candidatus Sumerlaeaceae bacterium]